MNRYILILVVVKLIFVIDCQSILDVDFSPGRTGIFASESDCKGDEFKVEEYATFNMSPPHGSNGFFLNIAGSGCLLTKPFPFTPGSGVVLVYFSISPGVKLEIIINDQVFEPDLSFTSWGNFVKTLEDISGLFQVKFLATYVSGNPLLIIDRFEVTPPPDRKNENIADHITFKVSSTSPVTEATTEDFKFKQKKQVVSNPDVTGNEENKTGSTESDGPESSSDKGNETNVTPEQSKDEEAKSNKNEDKPDQGIEGSTDKDSPKSSKNKEDEGYTENKNPDQAESEENEEKEKVEGNEEDEKPETSKDEEIDGEKKDSDDEVLSGSNENKPNENNASMIESRPGVEAGKQPINLDEDRPLMNPVDIGEKVIDYKSINDNEDYYAPWSLDKMRSVFFRAINQSESERLEIIDQKNRNFWGTAAVTGIVLSVLILAGLFAVTLFFINSKCIS